MKSLFTHLAGSLPVVATSPLALLGLLALIASATFLFWKQSAFRSLANTLQSLPEKDRLERIRIDYGVRPRRGVSAHTWLTSRRQELLFWGYVSTLLMALLAFVVVYGRMIQLPGGANNEQLRKHFAVLRDELSSYELAGRNMRDAFVLAGENAIEPDQATAALLSERIVEYNAVYDDLRTKRTLYIEPVLSLLDDHPDLAREVNGLTEYAMQDLHQSCLIQFNDAAFRRAQQVRAVPASADAREVRLLRAQGALEIQALGSKANTLLDVLSQRLQRLSTQILGQA